MTGKTIVVRGPTYLIYEAASIAFGLDLQQPLPKKVDHIKMPQTKKEWLANDFTGKYFNNIIFMLETLAVLTENDYNAFPTYSKICSLGLSFDIVPDPNIVREQQRKFDHYINNRPEVDMVSIRNQQAYNLMVERALKFYPNGSPRFNEIIKKSIDVLRSNVEHVLINGYSDRINEKFTQFKDFLRLNVYDEFIESKFNKSVEQSLIKLKEIGAIQTSLDILISMNEQNANKQKIKSMSVKTKSPNFPNNMESREIVRNRIRLQPKLIAQVRTDSQGNQYTVHRPDPNEPPQFVEKINIKELKRTNRSQFMSYEELEQMTPLTNEVLAALPEKKRTELLRELKAACNEMKDTITDTRFDRMRKKQLHLIVRLGKPPVQQPLGQEQPPGQQRCYYVRNAYKAWQQAVDKNKPFTNPETREKITEEEKADIMHKIKYVKPDAVNPESTTNLVKDIELNLNIYHVPENPELFKVRIIRPFGNKVLLLMNLGYIPADIETEHSGSADITSAVAVYKFNQLFEKGRLLTSNFIPYMCCKVYLKEKSYWDGPMPERVRKLTNLLEEINNLL